MQVKTNGNRNLSFEAPKKFKLLQNGVEIPYIRTGKNSVRLSRNVDGVLDVEEIQEAPKSIVKPMKLQPQQMALVNPNDVIAINQAAQQLEIEQNILSENQKRLEYAQDYIDIQQQKINQAVESVGMLETDNKERLDKAESSIFNLAGEITKTGEQSINAIISVDEKINQHENAENPHKITKKTIKLDKVDNTSDLDKPVSKAVQAELDKKADKEELESIKEEISNYQEKTDRFNDALSNYTGGIGGTELPSGGFTGQLLAKKTDLTGDYEWVSPDLDVGDGVLTIQKNGTDIDSFSANAKTDKTINITVPTQASDIDALPDSTKYGSSLALSIDSSTYIITAQLKDQDGNNLGSSQTIDLPLESVVVNGSYDSENKKIVLTLENGNTIEIPVGDLISGLQTEITSENKLNADLVDDSTSINKFVTANDKTTWNSKQDALTAGTGIDITSDVISNSGVRAVSTGATNGKISVNTNGTSTEVSVYGLGSAAYTSSSDYDASGSASTAETNAKNYADSLASNYATAAQGALADTALQSGDNISELVNDSGFITGINSSDVTTALGYTPYNSSNPNGYQANIIETVKVNGTALTPSSKAVDVTVPTKTSDLTNDDGFISGINSTDVTTALGYTPYDSSNPSGYTSNVGTVTSVNNTSPDGSGNVTITIPDPLPSQTGQSGKFLTTDGSSASWASFSASTAWGDITGTLSNQADLQTALDAKQDEATAVSYGNISNCLTNIPQDVKLEIDSNGHLVLKAGTKVYIPNGFTGTTPKFNEFVLSSDIRIQDKPTSSTDTSTRNIIIKTNGGVAGFEFRFLLTDCYSGSTAPTVSGNALWYDTANNIVKVTYDSGSTWVSDHEICLPLGIFTRSGATESITINQVFNGFGYVGNTYYAFPGVKGLVPNGRNTDGTLKNTEFTVSNVLTFTKSGTPTFSTNIAINGAGTGLSYNTYSYDEINNVSLSAPGCANVGDVSYASGRITSFTPKTAFHAVDYSEYKATLGDIETLINAL